MAGLSDMEELLSEISNRNLVDYMREAIACYSGGAYRGCIVMSYIALFDDIREKLSELAKVNKEAKKIWKDVEKRSGDQEIFESFMADKLKAEGFLEESKYQRLNLVRDLRNKAAHPSGVHASAEEARFVFRAVIVEFLSESLLKTTHAVDALIENLGSSNFFPTSQMSDIRGIVEDELGEIHDAALPYLVVQLLDTREVGDSNSKLNSERFIIGMASLGLDESRQLLRKKVISECSVSEDNAAFIGRLVSADATLLEGLSSKNHSRVCKLLQKNADDLKNFVSTKISSPIKQFASMAQALGQDDILKYYDAYVDNIFAKYSYAPEFFNALKDKDKIAKRLVDIWKRNASSSTFDVANNFSSSIAEIDSAVGILLNDRDAFEIIAGVKQAADWNAFTSKSLVKSNFSDAPKLVEAAKNYIAKEEEAAKDYIASKSIADSLEDFASDVFEN